MPIDQLIAPREKDLGGFSVRRLLPCAKRRMVGPWIFFDHIGPAVFPAGKGIDVRPHPHINLATVTYLFEGEMLHRDSLGSVQAIQPGAVNLMVAGRGIVHSERENDAVRGIDHQLHGLQLWHALPEAQEEMDPAFHHIPADAMPAFVHDGVTVRVMMGEAYGVSSPVPTFSPILYCEAEIPAGGRLAVPQAEELALYVVSGEVEVGGGAVSSHHMAVMEQGAEAVVEAAKPSRIALIGGASLGPRYIEWNFVSSRKERIEQAKDDWRAGRFATVPGDEEEFIPLPE